MDQIKHLPIAKSNANRLLIMAYLAGVFPRVREALFSQRDWEDCPDDVRIMCCVLQKMASRTETVPSPDASFTLLDVGAAGTVLRFVTALAAVVTERPLQITGTTRLKNRPLRPLLDELNALGADIRGEWNEENIHAPLTIYPPSHPLRGGALSSTFDRKSSQFISALLMVAPYFSAPFSIPELPRRGNSYPYIELTLAMMREAGADWSYTENGVVVRPGGYSGDRLLKMAQAPEMDWSAASYAFGWSAVSRRPVFLPSLRASDRQGDKAIVGFMRPLGVEARFLEGGGVELIPIDVPRLTCYTPEGLNEVPDLVPTLVVTALMRRQPFLMQGVASLRLKESDRLRQLVETAALFGFRLDEGEDSLAWDGAFSPVEAQRTILVDTAEDHRMAMAWSLASLLYPQVQYTDASVVSKSYPGFWREPIFAALPH